MNFYKTSKKFILANFLLPHCPTACLMHPVKHNGKLATATALLLWWNAQNFIAKKPSQYSMRVCMHCSLTVLALIFLYGGHCSSVQFPSKITCSFQHYAQVSRIMSQ